MLSIFLFYSLYILAEVTAPFRNLPEAKSVLRKFKNNKQINKYCILLRSSFG